MPLFALQLVGSRAGAEGWLPLVREAVRSGSAAGSHRMSGALLDVCAILSGGMSELSWGFWELVDDPEEATEDFHSWYQGSITDAEEERDDWDPDGRHMAFVTILVLVEDGAAAHASLWAESDRLPEGEEATRRAYLHWLTILPNVDLTSVRAVSVIVRPGSEHGAGLMADMLEEEGYEHLIPILF